MAFVELRGVSKHFDSSVAVEKIDANIEQGEFFSLLGPSGCGKSTTLRMLAGFLTPTSGTIHIHGRDITNLPPEKRGIGIVFQNYAIFPHMNVYDNIAFGLVERGADKAEISRKVGAALDQVGMSGYEKRFERELSGGQKQRVALARVLVIEPEILLLDEPLSALDKKMREEMKYWIKDIQKSIGITTIYVTHDQSEALTMSDRIAVMNQGRMLQIGTPTQIYEEPASHFIAEFIGDSNLIEASITSVNGINCEVSLGNNLIVPARVTGETKVAVGDDVRLLLRPEMVRLEPLSKNEAPRMTGKIVSEVYLGAMRRYKIQVANHEITAEVPNRPELGRLHIGDSVELFWSTENGVVVPYGTSSKEKL